MRTAIDGYGNDSTARLAQYLRTRNQVRFANLILVGVPENPNSIRLTDWESPLLYPPWGTFQNAVVSRSTVKSKIGFDVSPLTISWTPRNQPWSANVNTANPYQLAQAGYYDNWPVRVWTVYMPTPGDCMTFGATALFGGYIGDSTTARGKIDLTVRSFLAVTGQQVPNNVIEILNTAAAYRGATPPKGFANIPQFNAFTDSNTNVVIGDQTFPDAHSILNTNVAQGGFIVFNSGPGMTLGGIWSAIQQNISVTIAGTPYNQFVLYAPLPWPPTPGVDTFYISGAAPINQPDQWQPGHAYALGNQVQDTNYNLQEATTAGTSGGSAPSWNATVGGTTADGGGSLVWTNRGPQPYFGFPYVPNPLSAA